jgi:hypothetical protein
MAIALDPPAASVARPAVGAPVRLTVAVLALALAPLHLLVDPSPVVGLDLGLLMPADLVMGAGALIGAVDLVRAIGERRTVPGRVLPVPRTVLGQAWLGFAGVYLLSAAVHQSGAWSVVRLAGMTVMVRTVAATVAGRRWVPLVRAMSAAVLVQAAVAAAQVAAEGPVGLAALGERASAFRPIQGVFAPAGTTIHTNTLAVYAAVLAVLIAVAWADGQLHGRADRAVALSASAAAGAIVGLSFSRTCVLGLVMSLPLVVVGAGRTARSGRRFGGGWSAMVPVAVVVLGFALTAAVRADGWVSRVEQSAGGTGEPIGSGRTATARQAVELLKLDPLLGVGPGNYALVMLNTPRIDALSPEHTIVHNLALFTAASVGLAGLAALAGWGAALLGVTRRGRWPAWAVLASLVAPLGLDVALYLGSGWVVLCVAVGVVVGLGRRDDGSARLRERP